MKTFILWDGADYVDGVKNILAELDKDADIKYFWDDKLSDKITTGLGCKSISFEELLDKYKEKEIDGIILSAAHSHHLALDVWKVVKLLVSNGINEDDIFVIPSTFYRMKTEDFNDYERDNYFMPYKAFSEPYVIKFMAYEGCNLNCSGCTHFSPLKSHPHMLTLEELERHLSRIKELFVYVSVFQFLGGEPLMNKDLHRMIELTNRYFPFSRITIITNGLLIPKMTDEFWNVCRKYSVTLLITRYMPVDKIADLITSICEEKQVKYMLTSLVKNFRRQYNTNGKGDKNELHSKCYDYICHTIVGDNIGGCYYPVTAKAANEHFGLNLPYENSVYDLYSDKYSGHELLEKLTSPCEMCSYCNGILSKSVEWSQCRKETAEFDSWFLNE